MQRPECLDDIYGCRHLSVQRFKPVYDLDRILSLNCRFFPVVSHIQIVKLCIFCRSRIHQIAEGLRLSIDHVIFRDMLGPEELFASFRGSVPHILDQIIPKLFRMFQFVIKIPFQSVLSALIFHNIDDTLSSGSDLPAYNSFSAVFHGDSLPVF